jgi:hypothetical protein
MGLLLGRKEGATKKPAGVLLALAESEGFEPSIPFRGIHTFQACSFNHSDKSPLKKGANLGFVTIA